MLQYQGNFQFEESGLPVDNPANCVSAFIDFDYDGDQDLVTASCNIIEPSDDGSFQPIPGPIILFKNTLKETGALGFEDVTEDLFGELGGGFWMAISMADLNGDGRMDSYFGNLGYTPELNLLEQHVLMVSEPDGTYANVSISSRLAKTPFNWGAAFVDLDNNGAVDLVTCGANILPLGDSVLTNPGSVFLNGRDGAFFPVQLLGLSQLKTGGLAVADFDEDGSQDVLIVGDGVTSPPAQVGEKFSDTGRLALFRGTARKDRHVAFRLKGVQSSKGGIGAFVNVCPSAQTRGNGQSSTGGQRREASCQQRMLTTASSASSTHSPILHFGVPEGVEKVDVRVVWPSGQEDEFKEMAMGRQYLLEEGRDEPFFR